MDALTRPTSWNGCPTQDEKEDDISHNMVRLDLIDFSGSSLEHVPHPTVSLAAICKLDLSNNNLHNIPECVTAGLLNVVSLDLHSNQLTSLPHSIGRLSKLKFFNVSGNLLPSLPTSIHNCRMLEELSANFNKLTALPETIGFELVNLKKLSVNSNQIMFLPRSTRCLTALHTLDVRLNCLRSLPQDLECLVNLQVLNTSQNFNYLNKLPYTLGLIVSLVELDVSYNNITTLPSSISCMTKLRKLRAEGNPLVSPPMYVVNMGLHTVRLYLTGQLSTAHNCSPKQKKSWFGQFKKHWTGNGKAHDNNGLFTYQHIEAVASSPRYLSILAFTKRTLPSPIQ